MIEFAQRLFSSDFMPHGVCLRATGSPPLWKFHVSLPAPS
jgi:hypothetical protein